MMKQNPIKDKSFAFAVRAYKLHRYLIENKKEYLLSRQFARSGTSIGANVSEALRAQTKPDFIAKMSIALKEANETEYWLRLLYTTDFLTKHEFESMYRDIDELISMLVTICKTASQNQKQNARSRNN